MVLQFPDLHVLDSKLQKSDWIKREDSGSIPVNEMLGVGKKEHGS